MLLVIQYTGSIDGFDGTPLVGIEIVELVVVSVLWHDMVTEIDTAR